MPDTNLRVDVSDGVARLTFDRPDLRNALTKEMLGELAATLDRLEDDDAAGVLVFSGAGGKVFVSGANIRDLADRTARDGVERKLSRFYERLETYPKPTIASIHGFCLGGGLEFALACDIRVGSTAARLGFPETGLGILPSGGGTQRTPRIAGLGAAKYLVLTGEIVPAEEAMRLGLLHKVFPDDRLDEETLAIARTILSRGPLATRLAKASLQAATETPLRQGLVIEALHQAVCYESEDKREGIAAFLEKRKPEFRGR